MNNDPGEKRTDSQSLDWHTLAEFSVPTASGSDRLAMDAVGKVLAGIDIPPARLEALKTAVAEATLNAMEHGNHLDPDLPVEIRVLISGNVLSVRISDQGSGEIVQKETPDIDEKIAGRQPVRGWGFFLIEKMVDEVRFTGDESHHEIELFVYLEDRAA